MEFVDLTPTDEGYATISGRLIAAILSDIPIKRREDARKMLTQIVDITYYLGNKSEGLELREQIKEAGRL